MVESAAAASFWRFSLLLYGRPGLAEALVRLQDRAGHNVNLSLFGLWLGLCEGRRLDAVGLARAQAASQGLDHGVVGPLRSLRRALKEAADPDVRDLRRRVLALEIAAERRVQAKLAATAERVAQEPGDRYDIAAHNFRLVLGPDSTSTEAVTIMRAIEPASRPRPSV